MSVIANFQVDGTFPSTVGGTGSTVKYFPRFLGTSIGVESVAPSASSAAGQLAVPGFNRLNGQWFDVLVGGNVKSGSSDSSVSVKVDLSANTGTVASPTYTIIATTGAVPAPLTGTNYAFGIKVALYGDTASGIVKGYQKSVIGATVNAEAALTVGLSAIDFSAAVPFGLVVSVTFGTSDANNAGSLYQFQVVEQ